MTTVWRDLKYAARMLRKSPSFTAAAVLTLALGVGCSMVMFSLFESVIVDRPPVSDQKRLARVWGVNQETGSDRALVSIPNFLDLRERTTAFEELAAFTGTDRLLTGMGEPHRVAAQTVSANFLTLLGATPKIGRVFVPEDERPGAPRLTVVSEIMWRTRYAGNPGVLGHSIYLDGLPHTVIGVLPSNFWFPSRGTEVWTALTMDPSANRASETLMVLGRLRSGATAEQAQAEMATVARSLQLQFPSANRGISVRVASFESEQHKKTGLALGFGIGPAILVLLIGCANVTNLLLAGGFSRQTEFATRAALGAGRGRIVRQLLTENLLIVVAGAAAGTLASYAGIAILRSAFHSVNSNTADELRLNWHVLAFGTVAAVLVPLIFGLVPAVRASRANLNDALRQTGTAMDAQISFKRLPLVVFEIALAMLLLVVAGLFGRALVNIERIAPPKIDTSRLISFTITPTTQVPGVDLLSAELSTVPGIAAVGAADYFPILAASRDKKALWMSRGGMNTQISAIQISVNAGFFEALQLSALQGELPTGSELTGAVVSESFTRHQGGNVIGSRIRASDNTWVVVTGIVRDWLTDPRSSEPVPIVYFPLSKTGGPVNVIVRTDGGPAVIPALKRAVRLRCPDQPVEDYKTIAQSINDEFAGSRLVVQMIGVFAVLALVLASVGVYGVMNYSIARRTREMGIRIALGATPGAILALVFREAALLMMVGLSVGWLAGVGAAHIIAHELAGVTPADPETALICSSVILVTGFMASYFPARRAASVDPMVAVRYE